MSFKKGDIYRGTTDIYGNVEEPVNFYIQNENGSFKTLVDTPTRYKGEYWGFLSVYIDLQKIGSIYDY